MNGGKLLHEALKKAGVKRVYGLIGTTIVGLVDSFYQEAAIRYLSTRHEQVAGSMADVEGRITGQPGVCFLHAGPGLLQAAISIGDAYKDCSPSLFVAGTVRRRIQGRDGFVEIDAEAVFSSLINGFYKAGGAEEIPQKFKEAYEATFLNGGGPAILEVPEDVWAEEAEVDIPVIQLPDPLPPDHHDLEKALSLFNQGERKALFLGRGAKGIASEALLSFVRKYDLPVITTVNARGIVDEADPLNFGPCGFAAQNPPADAILQTADTLLCLGCTISDMSSYQFTSPLPQTIIIVNVSAKSLEVFREEATFVQADAGLFFSSFSSQCQGVKTQDKSWRAELEKKRESWQAQLLNLANASKKPVSAAYILQQLYPMLPRDYAYAVGAGIHVTYAMHFLPVHERNAFFMAHNFGAMGFGFPAALGASLLLPDREVLGVIGDGDFMMTVQDLETAVREKLNVCVFVINDFCYRALTTTQKLMFQGHVVGSTHGNPDFARLSESFGGKGFTISQPEDVKPVLEKALAEKGLRVVDCQIDADDPAPLNLDAVLRMKMA